MSVPRLARVVLGVLLPAADREYILGDLEEAYVTSSATRGRLYACRRYLLLGLQSVIAQWQSPRRTVRPVPPVKGSSIMDRLGQDLRLALRGLMRKPALTFAIVLTLALAIGVNTAMFSVVHAVLLRPLPFPAPEQLITLWQASSEEPDARGLVSDANFRDWQQARSLSGLATYRNSSPTLTGLGEPEVVSAGRVSEDFFRVLGHPLLSGRGFTRDEMGVHAARLVVLGEAFWRARLNADRMVLGRTLTLNGEPHEIIGVAPDALGFPAGAQLWLNERINPETCGRGCVAVNAVGRLAPGATVASARSELAAITARIAEEYPRPAANLRLNLVTLEDLLVGSVRRGLFILLGAVAVVLLIACANIANLLLSGAAARQAEMAVRTSLGAARTRIVQQLLTESLLLAVGGALLGVLLAHWAIKLLGLWAGAALPRFDGVSINAAVLGFTALVMVGAALMFGLAPAILLARTDPGRVLTGARGNVGAGPRRLFGRATLITSQVALSIVLLIGTGLLLRSLAELRSVELGFDGERVETFMVSLPDARYPEPLDAVQFFAELQRRLRDLPGVEAVGGIAGVPLGNITFGTSFRPLDRPPYADGDGPSASFRPVLAGYFETLRIPLLQGRTFTERDTHEQPRVVVVSQALADRIWPGQNPIGKQIDLDASAGFSEDQPRTVVGVVSDVRSSGLETVNQNELYIPHAQSGPNLLTFVVRTRAGVPSALPGVRQLIRGLDPLLPVREARTLEQSIEARLLTPTFYFTLLGMFAALALALSAIGLYGVVGYQVALRRREVGVRMAIGARLSDVIRLISWQGFRPAAVGIVLGIAVAAFAVKALDTLLYNTPMTDRATWLGVSALVCVVVLLACVLPALNAARISPAEALRSE